MKRISVLLIAVALVVCMSGCFTPFRMHYQLTLSSTEGGEVIMPGEGTFTYWGGTTVNLVAESEEGYRFVNWTGDACACNIADINAASTNITMNNDYTITANFAPGIWDWYDLDAIRDNLGGNHTLMNDLDSTTAGYEELASPTANGGKGWEPIGIEDSPFTGTFDGQGYEIRDLFSNHPDEMYVGLFGVVREGGVVQNIGVVNADVTGNEGVGGLVGNNDWSTVSNSYATGSVTGEDGVGGLVGISFAGTVSDSYSTGSVAGVDEVGGLVGASVVGTVRYSYSTGSVTGDSCVGGLVGFNEAIVSKCYSGGDVTGEGGVGGLVGINWGTVSDSYSTGSVTGNSSVGGLVGNSWDSAVSNSFWDTETSGQASSDGGTGKNTTEMQDITTFSGAGWDIIEVGAPGERNPSYIWNIVDDETYPFLSWEPVS